MQKQSITGEQKQQILNTILDSEEFANAEKYQELLKFLAETSKDCTMVKESTIAIEFFGKDTSFDPSIDSTVRAYISNLRKKLEHYYLTKGLNDPVQLKLPKGHYHVEFEQKQPKTIPVKQKKRSRLPVTIILSLLLAAALLFIIQDKLFKNNHSISILPKEHPVWQGIFQNNKKTLIVLGDYYFFSLPFEESRQSYIRDVKINSDSDLEQFINNHKAYRNKIQKTYHTYLEEHIPLCIAEIMPSLYVHDCNYEIKLSSELQIEDLQKFNIIYIGPYKCLNLLTIVTNRLNYEYNLRQGSSQLSFFDVNRSEKYLYKWITNPETNARNDYAMVIKVSGGNDNTFMFFISEHDFGNIGTIRYFTDPQTIASFTDQVNDKNFEALFEVTGIIRTSFSVEMKHLNFLHSDFEIDLK